MKSVSTITATSFNENWPSVAIGANQQSWGCNNHTPAAQSVQMNLADQPMVIAESGDARSLSEDTERKKIAGRHLSCKTSLGSRWIQKQEIRSKWIGNERVIGLNTGIPQQQLKTEGLSDMDIAIHDAPQRLLGGWGNPRYLSQCLSLLIGVLEKHAWRSNCQSSSYKLHCHNSVMVVNDGSWCLRNGY